MTEGLPTPLSPGRSAQVAPLPGWARALVLGLQGGILGLARHWLLALNLALGVFVVLPWLAPVLMSLGWEPAAGVIYRAYSFVCHQLPQRSYFLFGPKLTYSPAEIQTFFPATEPDALRAFVGTPLLGYKVAYAHRLSAIYAAALAGGLAFAALRRRLRPPSLRLYLLLILPMALDGTSHLLTDLGLVDWRVANGWAQRLLGSGAGPAFFSGNGLGSFNWLLRAATGALFGLASAWLVLPHLERAFAEVRDELEPRRRRRRGAVPRPEA